MDMIIDIDHNMLLIEIKAYNRFSLQNVWNPEPEKKPRSNQPWKHRDKQPWRNIP